MKSEFKSSTKREDKMKENKQSRSSETRNDSGRREKIKIQKKFKNQ